MAPKTLRTVSWIKAARKDFGDFPAKAQDKALDALTIVADGAMPDIAKPLTGLGAGVLELVIKERSDAYRIVYALKLDDDIWVVHAFQKKSTSGIATPKHEIDLVRDRIKRLKEMLK
jgi:phage-related protein